MSPYTKYLVWGTLRRILRGYDPMPSTWVQPRGWTLAVLYHIPMTWVPWHIHVIVYRNHDNIEYACRAATKKTRCTQWYTVIAYHWAHLGVAGSRNLVHQGVLSGQHSIFINEYTWSSIYIVTCIWYDMFIVTFNWYIFIVTSVHRCIYIWS